MNICRKLELLCTLKGILKRKMKLTFVQYFTYVTPAIFLLKTENDILACKDFRSHHFLLKIKGWPYRTSWQLFLDPSENWGHKASHCPSNLDRQTGKHRESQFTGEKTNKQKKPEQKPPQTPVPRYKNLNYNWEILGAWTSLRGKTLGWPSLRGTPWDLQILPPGTQTDFCKGSGETILKHAILFSTRPAFMRKDFTSV